MEFAAPLIKGKILKRYKRFLADIELEENGEIITAHTANTGSMKTCWEPGWPVLLSFHDNPKRKLKYSLEMTHNGRTWIGVNTALPNKLAIEAIEKELIPELAGYTTIKAEAKIGKSRIDILLKADNRPDCYVEVKNVTLGYDNAEAQFPDGVSARGQKHLQELMDIVADGKRGCMLYIVQRKDVNRFAPAKDIDPEYARLLQEAHTKGVEVLVYQCDMAPEGIIVERSLPFNLDN